MTSRLLRACLLAGALGWSLAGGASEILIAASHDSPALQRFVAALQQRRPDERVRLLPSHERTTPDALPADARLILLGADLLDWRLGHAAGPPTLILQISRLQAQQRLGEQRPPRLTLLWSDPPPARQLQLIRRLLPQARRVGVLYSAHSVVLADELRRMTAPPGLTLEFQYWPDTGDSQPLNRLLDSSDVLLGLDDPTLYNPSSIKGILLASYGRKQALIGPTAAFIRAGSLSSTYSDQQDWLASLDALLDRAPRHWPRAAYPAHFKVLSNPQVARSLGIELDDDARQAERLRQGEPQP